MSIFKLINLNNSNDKKIISTYISTHLQHLYILLLFCMSYWNKIMNQLERNGLAKRFKNYNKNNILQENREGLN